MRTTDTHVYFYSGPFSNFYPIAFQYGPYTFSNSEQAFMWQKALFFEDYDTLNKIILEPDPMKVKTLGRLIKGYNDEEWNNVRLKRMTYVNRLKFHQNPSLREVLIRTANKILVEASPFDKIWGVGLAENDDLILDEKNWLGQNLLGKALMEVRRLVK